MHANAILRLRVARARRLRTRHLRTRARLVRSAASHGRALFANVNVLRELWAQGQGLVRGFRCEITTPRRSSCSRARLGFGTWPTTEGRGYGAPCAAPPWLPDTRKWGCPYALQGCVGVSITFTHARLCVRDTFFTPAGSTAWLCTDAGLLSVWAPPALGAAPGATAAGRAHARQWRFAQRALMKSLSLRTRTCSPCSAGQQQQDCAGAP